MPNFATRAPHVELIAEMIREALVNINTTAVAKIQSVEGNRATVVPLHKIIYDSRGADGKNEALAVPALTNVPIAYFGSPGFKLYSKPKPGDYGLLFVSQRSLDKVKAALEGNTEGTGFPQAAPDDQRLFDINDSIFFPCYLGGMGPDNFSGAVSKGGGLLGAAGLGGESKVGFQDGKVKVAASTPVGEADLSSILNDMQSQIDRTNTALVNVAASGGLATAAGVPAAVSAKIKNKISAVKTNIRKVAGFTSPENLLDIFNIGRKILGVFPDGTIDRAPAKTAEQIETEQSQPPRAQVIIQPRLLYAGRGGAMAVGFIAPGVNHISGNFFRENLGNVRRSFDPFPQGDGDFSIFYNKPEARFWADCVGCIIYRPSERGVARIACMWPRQTFSPPSIDYISRIYVNLKDPADNSYNQTDDFVGAATLRGGLSDMFSPANPSASLPGLSGTWGDLGRSQGLGASSIVFENSQGFFREFWGAYTSSLRGEEGGWSPVRPLWYLEFGDSRDFAVTLDAG